MIFRLTFAFVASLTAFVVTEPSIASAAYQFSHLAGRYSGAETNGNSLGFPSGISINEQGDLFIADAHNYRILVHRKSGNTACLAGLTGVAGNVDGKGNQARFGTLGQILVAHNGDIWVIDETNQSIRKVLGDGTVITVCTETPTPTAITQSRDGKIWATGAGWIGFVDETNGVIQTVVSFLSFPRVSQIVKPTSLLEVAVDRFWLIDAPNNENQGSFILRSFTADGRELDRPVPKSDAGVTDRLIISNIVQSNDGTIFALGTEPQIEVDSIAKMSLSGDYTWFRTQSYQSVGSYIPSDLSIDSSGKLFTLDSVNGSVFSWEGASPVKELGSDIKLFDPYLLEGPLEKVTIDSISDIIIDPADNILLFDLQHKVIRKIDPEKQVTIFAGLSDSNTYVDGPASVATLDAPEGGAMDSDGILYFCEPNAGTVRQRLSSGEVRTIAGIPRSYGSTDGIYGVNTLTSPTDLCLLPDGGVLIVDYTANSIRILSKDGNLKTMSGGGSAGYSDGPVSSALWTNPVSVACDNIGNIYIAQNSCIRLIDTNGVVSLVAGDPNQNGYRNAAGRSALFDTIQKIRYLIDGELLVSENGRIRRVSTRSGEVSTLAGGESLGIRNGTGVTAKFGNSLVFAVTRAGSLVLADNYSSRLVLGQYIDPSALPSRIVNFSSRIRNLDGDDFPIMGVTISGSVATVLCRSVAMSLEQFGVSGNLGPSSLEILNNSGKPLFESSKWSGSETLKASFADVGAFQMIPNSQEGAGLVELSDGATYIEPRSGQSVGGIVLLEAYDYSLSNSGRLSNCSIRGRVDASGDTLIGGFVIRGNTQERILIRGIGPSLDQFGVSNPLKNTRLILYNSDAQKLRDCIPGTIDDQAITSAISAGAFVLNHSSEEVEIVQDLSPGAYTVQLYSGDNSSGVAILELYEIH